MTRAVTSTMITNCTAIRLDMMIQVAGGSRTQSLEGRRVRGRGGDDERVAHQADCRKSDGDAGGQDIHRSQGWDGTSHWNQKQRR